MNSKVHQPVLINEVIEFLSPQPGERYLDLTAGFGGHASQIAEMLGKNGRLTLVDRDEQAAGFLTDQFGADKRVEIIQDDFYSAAMNLTSNSAQFDCILADLGVSSYQLDEAGRGFSFDKEAPLDMRMDSGQKLTAQEVLNNYDREKLEGIFIRYGELSAKQTALLVDLLLEHRPLRATSELAALARTLPSKRGKRLEAQVFQAVRIEVNNELGLLRNALPVWAELLAPKGRLAVITFHSLEDRIVKQFFAQRSKNRYEADLSLLNKKPITANKNETVYNPRSRSAKLRVAVKK